MYTAYRKGTKPKPKMQKKHKTNKIKNKARKREGGGRDKNQHFRKKAYQKFSKSFKVGTGRSTVSRTAVTFWALKKAVS